LRSFATAAVCLLIAGAGAVGLQHHRAASARKLPVFRVVNLGTLGGDGTAATASDEKGAAFGRSQLPNGRWHAFEWRSGRMHDLGIRPQWESSVTAANRSGVVAGVTGPVLYHSSGTPGEVQAFIETEGAVQDFKAGSSFTYPHAINNHGDVVGAFVKRAISPDLEIFHGFLWHRGTVTDLTPASMGAARCINDSEDVVIINGDRPFLWEEGKLRKLTMMHDVSEVWLDQHGDVLGDEDVAGKSVLNDYTRGLLWHDGKRTDIGSLGGQSTQPSDMNGAGWIVGSSETGKTVMLPRSNFHFPVWHGFLWRHGKMQDLGVPPGAQHVYPKHINNSGVIGGLTEASTGDISSGKAKPFAWSNGHFVAYGLEPSAAKDWQIKSIVAVGPKGSLLANGLYRGSRRACWLVPEPAR